MSKVRGVQCQKKQTMEQKKSFLKCLFNSPIVLYTVVGVYSRTLNNK